MARKKLTHSEVFAESRATGKCLEDLLATQAPARYKKFCAEQRSASLRAYQVVQQRNIERAQKIIATLRGRTDAELDAAHRRLALSIEETIRLDAEYEARWEVIRRNLICAGAPRKLTEI